MPYHTSRENTGAARGLDLGVGPPMPWGLVAPAAVQLGLGEVMRASQPDRLRADVAPPSFAPNPVPRLQHPRTLDASRLLQFGAPAPIRAVEYAVMPYRPTEAPAHLQGMRALGGRYVGFGR